MTDDHQPERLPDVDPEAADGPTDPASRDHRANEAYRLRLAGMSFPDIAERLGYHSRSGAYNAFARRLRDQPAETLDEARAVELARLDLMLVALTPKLLSGEIGAQQTALKISAARARLVPGLAAPVEISLSHAMAELDAATRAYLDEARRHEQTEGT